MWTQKLELSKAELALLNHRKSWTKADQLKNAQPEETKKLQRVKAAVAALEWDEITD